MLEYIVLGAIQGITEWLPVSSDGFLVLAQTNFFGQTDLSSAIEVSLFLHIGTFFAALIYFWKDVKDLLIQLVHYKTLELWQKHLIQFYTIATLISGIIGFIILKSVEEFERVATLSANAITLIVAVCLLLTGLALKSRKGRKGIRTERDITKTDGVWMGIAQGLSALPGVSRSGTTVSTLLLRGINDEDALKLTFILSLPLIFGANIILSRDAIGAAGAPEITGLAVSFIVGIITIHYLMKLARKIDFSNFVLVFAGVIFLSLFL